MARKIRILLAKLGLDGHNRGVMVMAHAFKDAGTEVIYTGLHQTPEAVVATAIQRGVDVIGISMLSGAHMRYFQEVIELLKEKGADNIMVIGGGCIDAKDIPKLKRMGVAEIFTAGTPTTKAIEFVKENVRLE